MKNKALKAIQEHNMIKKGDNILVALSGGADSMALLSFLLEIKEEYRLTLYAAHINHHLRGQESQRDQEFVHRHCESIGIPLFVHHSDVAAMAKQRGESIEQAGRSVRYNFLKNKASELKALIATAHTLSDSLETMLLNLARGTALKGLCGIPPKRAGIIRPLIYCTRAEIEEYCRNNGISYIVDSTNTDTLYKRNFIRQNIVPEMLNLNPSLYKTLIRTQKALKQDEEYLSRQTEKALEDARMQEGYSVKKLLELPDALRSRSIIKIVEKHTNRHCHTVHLKAIENQIKKGTGMVSLGDSFALITQGILTFTSRPAGEISFSTPLLIGTLEIFEEITAKTSLMDIENYKKSKKFNKKLLTNSLDYDMIQGNALFTSRKAGDTFRPANRGITKSVKKLLNELKIPVHTREKLVFLRDDMGILWIEGIGADERCQVTDSTKRVLLIEIERG